MIVGLLTLDLHLPEADSLKSKRLLIKSLKDRIKNRYNVSIAEVDAHNLWQRSVIAMACVANEKRLINQVFEDVKKLIESMPSVELVDSTMEML
jgi:hypothetical protein